MQGLWTMARERLDVVTVLFNNRTYEILKGEFQHVGAGEAGRKAPTCSRSAGRISTG